LRLDEAPFLCAMSGSYFPALIPSTLTWVYG
jgi:hypothetical protein